MTDAIDPAKSGADLSRPPLRDMNPQTGGGFENALQQAEGSQSETAKVAQIDDRVVRRAAQTSPEFRFLLDGQVPRPSSDTDARRTVREFEFEFQIQKMTITRTDQTEHLGRKIEPAAETLTSLRERGYRAQPGVWQIRSHQIIQSLEMLSKTMEQSAAGMKTIFQTNA